MAVGSQRGFSLIEVMLAAGIFTAGFAGVIALQVAVSKGASTAGDISLASNLASSKLEDLGLRDYHSLDGVNEEYYQKNGELYDGSLTQRPYFTVQWTIVPHETIAAKDITVLVFWRFSLTESKGQDSTKWRRHEIELVGRVYDK